MTRYTCCDQLRRNATARHPTLNGIDYLEVLDGDAGASPRQRTLLLHFLKPLPTLAPDRLTPDHLALSGGERVRGIRIEWIALAAEAPPELAFLAAWPEADRILLVRTDAYGDFSPYRLRLQRAPDDPRAPRQFDPRLAEVTFSFKVECPSDFDCKPVHACGETGAAPIQIDYLAKDYASFRRLMLDRMLQLLPDWRARTPADLGVTLVELLAYAGDQLSYWQDAVATEAYLHTARRRTSLRRHALLVDYRPHEGSNARTWVQLELAAGVASATVALAGLRFLSRVPAVPERIGAAAFGRDYRDAFAAHPVVFEPLDPQGARQPGAAATLTLFAAHHDMAFHTWGDSRCCLPAGATSATLRGHFDQLAQGAVLVFEEVKGPLTGAAADANPAQRHAVRLTAVTADDDGAPLRDPGNDVEITEIAWAPADALPFALCISARTDQDHGARLIDGVSVARGNIILADHGLSVSAEPIGAMPDAALRLPPPRAAAHCDETEPEPIPPRFRPTLAQRPLTHAATRRRQVVRAGRRISELLAFDPAAPAAAVFDWAGEDVLPVVRLAGTSASASPPLPVPWEARSDLLNSSAGDAHFVVETEHDGAATLRFGDDQHGQRPQAGTTFVAAYRIGQGLAGNIGADALGHVITDDVRIARVRNPLPGRGGSEPESAEQVRRRAPQAFRTQQRAVTPADYAAVTGRHPGVQRAAAMQRWTGSWHTMFITVDRAGGAAIDRPYRAALAQAVEPFRMAGHDLEFNDPVPVPLEIALTVCVAPGHFRSDVLAELRQVLGNARLPDGRRGLFHPDGLSFGQPVYLSQVYAAARSVAGVESVQATVFARQGQFDDGQALRSGVMHIGRLEIARLDNDRNFPERGALRLVPYGGK